MLYLYSGLRYKHFFIDKIDNIRADYPLLEANLQSYSVLSMDSIIPRRTTSLETVDLITDTELLKQFLV